MMTNHGRSHRRVSAEAVIQAVFHLRLYDGVWILRTSICLTVFFNEQPNAFTLGAAAGSARDGRGTPRWPKRALVGPAQYVLANCARFLKRPSRNFCVAPRS